MRMSSCLVSDQNPSVFSSGGSRSDSAGRLHGTGFSRRRAANASSRSSSDLAQNDSGAQIDVVVGGGGRRGHGVMVGLFITAAGLVL